MSFQKDFLWGAAAASYQVEGAYQEDGKGLNIWDVYTREPGHVAFNENGDVACDHYHRFKEDVALMKQIGLKAYRLSITGDPQRHRRGKSRRYRLLQRTDR